MAIHFQVDQGTILIAFTDCLLAFTTYSASKTKQGGEL